MKTQTLAVCSVVMFVGVGSLEAQAITGNLGTTGVSYGGALGVQTINTSFGNSSGGGDASGSELDAIYGTISGGSLYLFVAGNFQNNGNHLNLFLADGRTGQSTLNTTVSPISAMNGSTFSSGFSATFAIDLNDYYNGTSATLYTSTADLVAGTGGFQGAVGLTGGIGSGTLGDGIEVALNNAHASTMGTAGLARTGATSGANTTTGLELAIPLSLLGNAAGSIEVLADINGGGNTYLSNQFLPGLSPGTGSLGTSTFDFASTPGEFVTVSPVPEPSTMMLGAAGMATLLLLRRRR